MVRIIIIALLIFCTSLNAIEILSPDDIKPGMTGIGKTVFSGTNIEEFNVEIIGVLKNNRPQGDIILAKLSGGPLAKTGVIAGMSGSPVYINGKLIGAVAHSWAFAKEPIAGITPIGDMIKIYKKGDNYEDSKRLYRDENGRLNNLELYADFEGDSVILNRIKTPVIFGGVDERLISVLRDNMSKHGLLPIPGSSSLESVPFGSTASGSTTKGEKKNDGESSGDSILKTKKILKPGNAIGVKLISGDLNVASVGIVTYTEGNNILAFGHPMFLRGKTSYPMTTAYVHSVMPTTYISFMLASAMDTIGVVKQDMITGIHGVIGEKADMIKVNVQYKDIDTTKTYRYEVINDILYTSQFVLTTSINSVLMNRAVLDKSTIEFEFKLKLSDGNEVKIGNTFSDITSIYSLFNGMNYLASAINKIMINKYKKVKINNIDVYINLKDEIRYVSIEDIKVNRKVVKPGDTINVFITCMPYLGDSFSKKFEIKIPDYIPDGRVLLFAGSALTEQMLNVFQNPFWGEATSYEQILETISKIQKSNDLMVWIQTSEKGLYIDGTEYPNLPGSTYDILMDSNKSGGTYMRVKYKKTLSTDYVIGGLKMMDIVVDRGEK